MTFILQYIRSVIFIVLMYILMPIIGLLGAIPALLSREWAYKTCKAYCVCVFWLARVLCGLTYEVRGSLPKGSFVLAAKHQSFFDVMVFFYELDKATFVMKKELKWAPVLGFYAMRIGAAMVDRSKKSSGTVSKMVDEVDQNKGGASQLIIYPQGTRVGPGIKKPYKIGAAVLAQRFDRPCVPAATNIGVFWPKRGFYRKPGVAVIEFFDPLPEDLKVEEMTQQMEAIIETNSNRLMVEAGFEFENDQQ